MLSKRFVIAAKGIQFWFDRNKIGLVIGIFFGILFSLFNFSLTKYLNWPAYVILGKLAATIVWLIIINSIIYGTVGAAIDSFLSPQIRDKRRAVIAIIILILIVMLFYFYRTNVLNETIYNPLTECVSNSDCGTGYVCSEDKCVLVPLVDKECYTTAQCGNSEICTNNMCEAYTPKEGIDFEVNINVGG